MPRTSISRRAFVAGSATIACAAIAARAWHVNSTAIAKPQVIEHEMNEWVALDGAFVFQIQERTNGYSLMVTDAELMSYNEYVGRYATDGSQPMEGLDVPSIVCLTVRVRNENNEEGYGIFVGAMELVPARKNEYFSLDSELFVASEPVMQESGNPGFAFGITPGTEYEVHLAYTPRNTSEVEVSGGETTLGRITPIKDAEFDWVISNAPVRHVIHVRLPEVDVAYA